MPRSSLLIKNTILKTLQTTTICPEIINIDLAITLKPVIITSSPIIIIIIL
jgi:hypothetical protein